MPSLQWFLDQEVKACKIDLPVSWSDYVFDFADWSSFVTLTFEKEYSRDTVYNYWRSLIQNLNHELYGSHYTRIVGHSYFPYCLCFEKQERGAYHLHALTAGILNYKMIHDFWNHVAGFAWITTAKDKRAVSIYCTKYVVKEGDLELYRPKRIKQPKFKPMWYLDVEALSHRK